MEVLVFVLIQEELRGDAEAVHHVCLLSLDELALVIFPKAVDASDLGHHLHLLFE